MRILLINGNTTPAVTASIEQAAREVTLPGTDVRALTPTIGPATVEGYLDGQLSALGVCEAISKHQDEADAFVIACFSDPGLYPARELSDKPVVGIAEAAMLTAVQLGHKFGLLTPERRLRSVLDGLVRTYGLSERLAGIRYVDQKVSELITPGEERLEMFLNAAIQSINEDAAEVLILAGAVMSGLEFELSQFLSAPVLDPVKCAVAQAQALVSLNLNTSRAGGFKRPYRKACLNCPPEIYASVYASVEKSQYNKE